MLTTIVFILDGAEPPSPAAERETSEAAAALTAQGYRSFVCTAHGVMLPPQLAGCLKEETLAVTDGPGTAAALLGRGYATAGYSHAGSRGRSFSGIPYVIEEPAEVDPDSYEKIFQRGRGLPWTILETERCVVREFTPDDMEAVCALYDGEARRWLEAPSGHKERERAILRAYIDRIYRLYGYGHWAVILKETGDLIGRMGYGVPRQAAGEALKGGEETEGITEEDGVLGYLLGARWRGQGLAEEVCRALIRYGLEEIGFARIAAEVHRDNAVSRRFLLKLGFRELPIPENARGERTYILG